MSGATISFALFWSLVGSAALVLVLGRWVHRATRRQQPDGAARG